MIARPKGVFEILHDGTLCKMCGICAAFCPAQCLAQDELGKVIVMEGRECIGCRLCELRCPDLAIEISEKAPAG